MTTDSSIYESGWLREITGSALRPGGVALTDRAIDWCGFHADAFLLDVGCGSGATVEHLRSKYGFNAWGVDISQKLIEEGLRRNSSLPLLTAAAEKLPASADSLDGVICECVLSLLDEPVKALHEYYRALRNGGYLIISDMYSRQAESVSGADITSLPPDVCTGSKTSRDQIESCLAECGFTVLLWEDHTRLLKELAARIMLIHGSLDGFMDTGNGPCCGKNKPGYYLLVARKDSLVS